MKKTAVISLAAALVLLAALLRAGASRPVPAGGPYAGSELSQLEAEQSFVEGEPARGLRVLIRAEYCESAEIRQNGRLVQTVSFTNGETAAGPLAPGAYTLAAGDAECAFTLAENASLRAVSGDGWTDGEVLYFGPGG